MITLAEWKEVIARVSNIDENKELALGGSGRDIALNTTTHQIPGTLRFLDGIWRFALPSKMTEIRPIQAKINGTTWLYYKWEATDISDDKISPIIPRDKVEVYVKATEGQGHVLMYGPPGTGKTTASTKMAANGQHITEITLREDLSDAAFWGQMMPRADENGNLKMQWESGPALIAWERGDLLIINEINKMNESIGARFYVLADHWSIAQDTLPNGKVVKAHPQCRILATMNGIPEELMEAVQDRFKILINVSHPSTEMYERLDEDVREIIREKYENADPIRGPEITFRNGLGFCELRKSISDDNVAAALVFGEREKTKSFIETLTMIRTKLAAEKKAKKDTKTTENVHRWELNATANCASCGNKIKFTDPATSGWINAATLTYQCLASPTGGHTPT